MNSNNNESKSHLIISLLIFNFCQKITLSTILELYLAFEKSYCINAHNFQTLYSSSITIAILKILLILSIILSLYSLSLILTGNNLTILAQQDLETTKYRNMVIDLGDGIKTNARLNLPSIGDGPFPAVLLVHGSGPVDMNETQDMLV